jgi:hypothetical protein
MKKLHVAAIALLALSCASSIALGQAVYGNIVGTVTDAQGAAVAQAKVTITDTGKGVSYNTRSNESGNYSQTHLVLGVYEVRVEAPGFQTYVQQNVHVEADATTQVNAAMSIGSVGEIVNVNAESPLLKTEKAEVSDTMTTKAVQELPVLGRDMSRLYFLVPGVQASGTTAASEQPQDVYRPNIGGQYWGGISFQLDGTDNRESVLGEPVITPNLDAVSELKITTTALTRSSGRRARPLFRRRPSREPMNCMGAHSGSGAIRTPRRAIHLRRHSRFRARTDA